MTITTAKPLQQITLRGLSWLTYQSLVEELEPHSGHRLTYDRGLLEIMVPLPPHEEYKRRLGRVVESTTEELGWEIRSLGSTTWKREDLQRGLEPDECYYIQNEAAVRGKAEIDLRMNPPPDLAIEIDCTSCSINRIDIYAALGIPEIWRYDGTTLTILGLRSQQYVELEQSETLPLFRRSDLLHFLQLAQTMGETSWVRMLRQWVRDKRSAAE